MKKLRKEVKFCPKCKFELWFEQFQGMRVINNDMLSAKCPQCNTYYQMPCQVSVQLSMYRIIKKWIKKHNLKKNDYNLLLNAYKRFYMLHPKKVLNTNLWLGLGMSEYEKSNYFKPAGSKRQKRCLGWFTLTDSGLIILVDLIKTLKWKAAYEEITFDGKVSLS